MNPIYAARVVMYKAESAWKAVDRDSNSTREQRLAALNAWEQAKGAYRAAFKQARAEK